MEINGKEVKINRKDAVVRDFDKQYCELLKKILEEGELFENRTGVDTLSIPGGGYVFGMVVVSSHRPGRHCAGADYRRRDPALWRKRRLVPVGHLDGGHLR